MSAPRTYTEQEAAARMKKSPRWLADARRTGRIVVPMLGRTPVYTDATISRILAEATAAAEATARQARQQRGEPSLAKQLDELRQQIEARRARTAERAAS